MEAFADFQVVIPPLSVTPTLALLQQQASINPINMFRADEGDGASLRRLCSQAECLRTRLRERLDNGDLSSAIKIAERSVGNNCIVALLAMVQCKWILIIY